MGKGRDLRQGLSYGRGSLPRCKSSKPFALISQPHTPVLLSRFTLFEGDASECGLCKTRLSAHTTLPDASGVLYASKPISPSAISRHQRIGGRRGRGNPHSARASPWRGFSPTPPPDSPGGHTKSGPVHQRSTQLPLRHRLAERPPTLGERTRIIRASLVWLGEHLTRHQAH